MYSGMIVLYKTGEELMFIGKEQSIGKIWSPKITACIVGAPKKVRG